MEPDLNYRACRNLVAAILYQAMADAAYPMNFQHYSPKRRRKETVSMQAEAREWLESQESKDWASNLDIERWPPGETALKQLRVELKLRQRRYMRNRVAIT